MSRNRLLNQGDNMNELVIHTIAVSCHELNRQYCIALGDTSQAEWDKAPAWQQDSAIRGVKFHLNNPDASPSASHDSWMKQKTEEGWSYGEVKDEVKKEHPCYVPYEQLPAEQKAKDYLFKTNVHNMADFYFAIHEQDF